MIKTLFLRQLQQLLYSIGEVEGMISPREEHALIDKVVNILSSDHTEDEEIKKELEVPKRPALIMDAAHALNSFLDFVDEKRTEFDSAIDRAFRVVAEELAGIYEITSKREKNLIAELKRKSGMNA